MFNKYHENIRLKKSVESYCEVFLNSISAHIIQEFVYKSQPIFISICWTGEHPGWVRIKAEY